MNLSEHIPLPTDLSNIIIDYICPKIVDWLDQKDLSSTEIYYNENATVEFLEKHYPDFETKINWQRLCCSKNVGHFIDHYIDRYKDKLCNVLLDNIKACSNEHLAPLLREIFKNYISDTDTRYSNIVENIQELPLNPRIEYIISAASTTVLSNYLNRLIHSLTINENNNVRNIMMVMLIMYPKKISYPYFLGWHGLDNLLATKIKDIDPAFSRVIAGFDQLPQDISLGNYLAQKNIFVSDMIFSKNIKNINQSLSLFANLDAPILIKRALQYYPNYIQNARIANCLLSNPSVREILSDSDLLLLINHHRVYVKYMYSLNHNLAVSRFCIEHSLFPLHEMNWTQISKLPQAVDLLIQHKEYINHKTLLKNPMICTVLDGIGIKYNDYLEMIFRPKLESKTLVYLASLLVSNENAIDIIKVFLKKYHQYYQSIFPNILLLNKKILY